MKTKSLMKKFAFLMSVLMVLTSMAVCVSAEEATINTADWSYWDGVSVDVTPFEGKDPTVDYDPEKGHTTIVIETAAQLAGLAKTVNESGQTGGKNGAYRFWPIYITKNIDLRGYKFTPIGLGYNTAAFGACLEGRLNGEEGKAITIKNLYIEEGSKVPVPGQSATEAINNAFIPTMRAGSLKNLTFDCAKVGHPNSLGDNAIVVGYASKLMTEISGITVKNSTVITGSGTASAGGVIAKLKNADASFTTLKDIHAENLNFVTRVSEDGLYSVERKVGGIVGLWEGANPLTFENCSYSGKIMALDTWTTIEADMYAGGFLGDTKGVKALTFKNCTYSGELAYAGADREAPISAFVGRHEGGNVTIEDCRVNGTVDALIGTDGKMVVTITNTTSANELAAVKGGTGNEVTGAVVVDEPVVEDPTEPPVVEDPTEPPVVEDPTEPSVDEPVEEVGFFQAIINAIIAFFKGLFGL